MCLNFLKNLFRKNETGRRTESTKTVMVRVCQPEAGGGYLVLPKDFFERLGDRKLVHADYRPGIDLVLIFLASADGVNVTTVKANRRIHSSFLAKALLKETGLTVTPTEIPFRLDGNALQIKFTKTV